MLDAVYVVTLTATLLVLVAAFSSLLSLRFGAPLLLLFLGIGLLAGEDGLGLSFSNSAAAYFIGSLALAIVLFDSGFGTPISTFRMAAAPALTLATVGVVLTTAIFALGAHFILDLSGLEALLLGSIVASTDAAAVFFLLRIGGINIRDRVRSALEVESGANDPMAIFLTIAVVELLSSGAGMDGIGLGLAVDFLMQMGVGFVAGLLGGVLIVALINRLKLDRGLTPIFTIALSLLVFSLTGALQGSGFLAVYVAGLYAGNRSIRAEATIRRFNDGLTWLAQIIMFLVLGLLATPSQFPAILLPALGLALFLIFVARPIAVWLCLLPFNFHRAETAFLSWVGLRGAVSILLAIVPVLGDLENGELFFNVVFIIVLVSLLVQGWTIGPVARWLGLIVPAHVGAIDKVELELPGTAHHELLVYRVVAGSPVAKGERVPRWARPSLVIRDGQSMRFQYAGRLRANDYVYLFIHQRYPRLLDRLFASPAILEGDDAEFFGAFAVDGSRPATELQAAYGPTLSDAEQAMTVSELMTSRLGGRAEYADRVPMGPVDLIVRDLDEDGRIQTVGISLEPETRSPNIPAFFNLREIKASISEIWKKRRASSFEPAPLADADTTVVESSAANPSSSIDFAADAASSNACAAPSHAVYSAQQAEQGVHGMAAFRTLDDVDVKNKRVLVRVDLNVPMQDGKVSDTTRIERIKPTITELAEKGARIILLAHFGRPKGAPDAQYSLKPIAEVAAGILGRPVAFVDDCIGEKAEASSQAIQGGDILLFENTRFHKGEEKNDLEFAQALAKSGDIFVNDAFSAAHRAHASTEGLAHLLPAYAGRTMQAELDALEKGLGLPQKPVVAIVGGAKVSTKIDLLQNLVGKVDALVIGGGMANTFLAAQGVNVAKSLCEHDLAETARAILAAAEQSGCAIVLPTDAVVAREFKANAASEVVYVDRVPQDAMILDVGPDTVQAVNAWIDKAKTLVWNGPMGAFEIAPFDKATVAAAKHAAERTKSNGLVSIAGGGDTVSALNHAGVEDGFTYVSTAGGAFLEWMEGKDLPGVLVLKQA